MYWGVRGLGLGAGRRTRGLWADRRAGDAPEDRAGLRDEGVPAGVGEEVGRGVGPPGRVVDRVRRSGLVLTAVLPGGRRRGRRTAGAGADRRGARTVQLRRGDVLHRGTDPG